MKSYIEYLYYLDLKENESNPPTSPTEKENNLYEMLQALLTKEQFEMFEKFVDIYGERMADECAHYFKKGFKYGIRLMIDCFNDNDEKKEINYEELF